MQEHFYRLWAAMSARGSEIEIDTLDAEQRHHAGRLVRARLAHVRAGRHTQARAAVRIDRWAGGSR
jgi:hypothetical protein